MTTHATIDERFADFHKANPHIYDRIVFFARVLKRRGINRCSINLIFERMRWDRLTQTTGKPYKLNNNFRACYAREVMANEPDLRGFFATRPRRSA